MWREEKPKTICTQSLFNHGFPADLQFCFELLQNNCMVFKHRGLLVRLSITQTGCTQPSLYMNRTCANV